MAWSVVNLMDGGPVRDDTAQRFGGGCDRSGCDDAWMGHGINGLGLGNLDIRPTDRHDSSPELGI